MGLEELKPCPFCGSAEVRECHDDGLYYVKCSNCCATGPETTRYSGEEGEEVFDWNRREFVKGSVLVDLKDHDTIADMILTHIDVWKNELVRRRNRCAENGDSVDVDYYNHELIALKDIELALSTTGAKQ